MIYIDQVHQEGNGLFLGITNLKYSEHLNQLGIKECSKGDMVRHIQQHPLSVKTKYLKAGTWTEGEYVRVVDNRYLRTDSNKISGDNLDNLIKF